MNIVEATTVLAMLDDNDPWDKKRDADAKLARAVGFAALLADAPDGWASGWLVGALRKRPSKPLTQGDVADAFFTPELSAAAKRALESIPRAPAEVEDNPARWVAWESARRAAIFAGSIDDAVSIADKAVGAIRPAATLVGEAAVADAKRRVKAVLAELARTHDHTTTVDDSTTDDEGDVR